METKSLPSKVMTIEDRDVTGISAVMGVVDAGNDVLFKGAFTKTISERLERIRHLWMHDAHMPPTATILELREVGRMELPLDMKDKWPQAKGGLLVKRRYLETERGNEILAGLKADPPAITEMSFGYDAVKYDFEEIKPGDEDSYPIMIRNLREVRLWDTSDVNWGMNEATVASMKSALPYKDTGNAGEDAEWKKPVLSDFTDGSWEDLSETERKRIASHFTWSVSMPPDSFGDLKLPHHQPAKSGVGPAVWNGVKAAMGALMGARGGVSGLSESDRKSVYNHLAKHYGAWEKEPPDLKVLDLLRSVDDVLFWLEKDKPANMEVDVLFQKLQELNDLLRAEPQPAMDAQAALTLRLEQEKLLRRLAIKRRQVSTISI